MNNFTSKHLLRKTSSVNIHFCPTGYSYFKYYSQGNQKIISNRAKNFLRKVIQQLQFTQLCTEVILLILVKVVFL